MSRHSYQDDGAERSHLQTVIGEWLSLVEHLVRDQGVGGSNPLSPTNPFIHSCTSAIFTVWFLVLSYRYKCRYFKPEAAVLCPASEMELRVSSDRRSMGKAAANSCGGSHHAAISWRRYSTPELDFDPDLVRSLAI
jgi:hypothetical protein